LPKEVVEVPISGKVTTCEVKLGDSVKEGDVICSIDAMKMENAIMAPHSGKIIELKVKPDQIVDAGETLAVIEY
jgi:biotin carboxyl carrier protein